MSRYLSSFSFEKEQVTKLKDIISEILTEHKEFQEFINCISLCNTDISMTIRSRTSLVVDTFQKFLSHGNSDSDSIGPFVWDTIVFANFGIKQLSNLRESRLDRKSLDKKIITLVSPNIDKISENKVNLLPDLTGFRSNQLNINHVMTLIREGKSCTSINEYIFVGKQDTLLAMIMTRGTLIIRWNVINSLLNSKKNSSKVKNILISLFSRFVEKNEIFKGLNVEKLTDKATSIVREGLNTPTIMQDVGYSADLTSDENTIYIFDRKDQIKFNDYIEQRIQDTITNLVHGTIYANDTTASFYKILADFITSIRRDIQASTTSAFRKGLQAKSQIDVSGWRLAFDYEIPKAFADDSTTIWWVKDCDFHPDKFVYREIVYTIDPSQLELYHVKKLFCSIDGIACIEGKHPNVNTVGQVCLGDLGSFRGSYDNPEELSSYLTKLEEMLFFINYDSPYETKKLKTHLDKGKKVEMASHQQSTKVDIKKSSARKLTTADMVFNQIENLESEDKQEEIVIVQDGEQVQQDQPLPTPAISQDYNILNGILRDLRNDASTNNSYITKDVNYFVQHEGLYIWALPDNEGIITLVHDYDFPYVYIKDRYSKAIKIPTTEQFNDIITYCKLRIRPDKLVKYDWWDQYINDPNKKLFALEIAAIEHEKEIKDVFKHYESILKDIVIDWIGSSSTANISDLNTTGNVGYTQSTSGSSTLEGSSISAQGTGEIPEEIEQEVTENVDYDGIAESLVDTEEDIAL